MPHELQMEWVGIGLVLRRIFDGHIQSNDSISFVGKQIANDLHQLLRTTHFHVNSSMPSPAVLCAPGHWTRLVIIETSRPLFEKSFRVRCAMAIALRNDNQIQNELQIMCCIRMSFLI